MVREIYADEFEKINKGKVVVDCYATWCGPCQMMAPIIEGVSDTVTDYDFYKLDIDKNPSITEIYGIVSVPTLLIFKDGDLVDREIGFKTEDELLEILK